MRRAPLLALATLACVVAGAVPAAAAGRCGSRAWCDTSLSDAKRAGLLVRALTPGERIGLLGGDVATGISGAAGGHIGEAFGVPRVGLPPLYLTDGPVGVRQGPSTALPASMALAASFDRRLARAHARVIAREARLKGNDVVYAPTVNLLRTPIWGRGFETFGEDPFLTSRLGVAWIRAAQGQGVIANVKHFAANNQEGSARPGGTTEGSRYSVNVRVAERPLRELYLPQFEAAVKEANVGSVMCSYNRLNGPHTCDSRLLLDRILRREWGFKGFVLADYAASKQVGSGLRAGLDFEPWPLLNTDGGESYTPERIRAALSAGRTTQAAVDRAARRLLRTLFAYGFFDRAAYTDDDSRVPRAAHRAASQAVAEAGTVLLKNRGGALPLDSRRIRSLAVIGADADKFKNGGGSSEIRPYSFTTPRQGLAARAGAGVSVRYNPGTDPAAAADAARGADAAVVVVADTASEFSDKPCIALDCGRRDTIARDALIERVAAVNPRTIVVLETSAPVLTPWRDRVEAIVAAWYPGDAGGSALARVLFGDVDPGGRLPATFPRRPADLPEAGRPSRYPGVNDVVRYSEGLLVGYRWFDARRLRPAFSFGHGLSYTRFSLRALRGRAARRGVGARLSVDVVNRGSRRGAAVPQLYLSPPGPRARNEPPRQLKGFSKLVISPGRRARARFTLDARAFSRWSSRRDRWVVIRGCHTARVGESSRDLAGRLRIAVDGARCGRGAISVPSR